MINKNYERMNRFIIGNKFSYRRWLDKDQGILWKVRRMNLINKQIQVKNKSFKKNCLVQNNKIQLRNKLVFKNIKILNFLIKIRKLKKALVQNL